MSWTRCSPEIGATRLTWPDAVSWCRGQAHDRPRHFALGLWHGCLRIRTVGLSAPTPSGRATLRNVGLTRRRDFIAGLFLAAAPCVGEAAPNCNHHSRWRHRQHQHDNSLLGGVFRGAAPVGRCRRAKPDAGFFDQQPPPIAHNLHCEPPSRWHGIVTLNSRVQHGAEGSPGTGHASRWAHVSWRQISKASDRIARWAWATR